MDGPSRYVQLLLSIRDAQATRDVIIVTFDIWSQPRPCVCFPDSGDRLNRTGVASPNFLAQLPYQTCNAASDGDERLYHPLRYTPEPC